MNTPISLDVQTYENNAKITATVNTDATGIVKFQITGPEKYSLYVDVINGHAILEDVLKTGNYNVVATYREIPHTMPMQLQKTLKSLDTS